MKKKLYFVFALVLSVFFTGCTNANNSLKKEDTTPAHKILLMSDIHVMSSKLIDDGAENSTTFKNYIAGDLKMLLQSEAVLDFLIQQAIEQKVNLVLVTGDLTKDGEYVCHEEVSQKLQKLRNEGIKVLVVPGNHDINNPRGVYYTGEQTVPCERTSVEQFESLYKDFGYDPDSSDYTNYQRDPSSLSYCCEPIKGLYMVCLDSCAYDENTETKNTTHGKLRESTLEWMYPLVDGARKKGKQVVVMMHHNLVEHFDGEYKWLNDYMVQNQSAIVDEFLEHDIELVLTGHVHAQDIARKYNSDKSRSITEIVTSSAVTYPCSYNILSFNKRFTYLTVQNQTIESIEGMEDYRERAKESLYVSLQTIRSKVSANWSKLDSALATAQNLGAQISYDFEGHGVDETAEMLYEVAGQTLTDFVRLFFAGGEDKSDLKAIRKEYNDTIKALANKLAPDDEKSRKKIINLVSIYFYNTVTSMITDTTSIAVSDLKDHTDDHNAVIRLHRR